LMIEILIAWVAFLTGFIIYQAYYNRRKDLAQRRLFQSIVEGIKAQQDINQSQYDINSTLSQHIEMLGVHTKLIPPTISMQAEAFLAWHNKRSEENNDG